MPERLGVFGHCGGAVRILASRWPCQVFGHVTQPRAHWPGWRCAATRGRASNRAKKPNLFLLPHSALLTSFRFLPRVEAQFQKKFVIGHGQSFAVHVSMFARHLAVVRSRPTSGTCPMFEPPTGHFQSLRRRRRQKTFDASRSWRC